jgi:two-component system copper resistance phosphate regulon response regulator CusR
MRVLLIEDQAEMREALQRRLQAVGEQVQGAPSLAEAELWLEGDEPFDVVVLDRGLPDGDGLDALGRWRSAGLQTPVLILTAQSEVAQRVAGLAAGADDYLGKPFAMAEFLARVAALGRRGAALPLSVERAGNLELDLGRRELRRAGVRIPLRPKEFLVLELLMRRRGRVVSRTELRRNCWGDEGGSSNVDEATIASLRRKLGSPPVIHTRRGQGYLFDSDDD